MRMLAAILLAISAAAGDAAWDWLPHAADDDRPCELHLTPADGWTVAEPDSAVTRISDGQLHITVLPQRADTIRCRGPAGTEMQVRLVAPGHGHGMDTDAAGNLRLGAAAAILAVPRREAAADRRWGFLRSLSTPRPAPCDLVLPEPAAVTWGSPALTRQVAAAQQVDVQGRSVLVELSGLDRFAGWKHREYRQTLAWLMADLAARGATRVVLEAPYAPTADAALLAPLRAQARDVAQAYRCTLIDTAALDDHANWETAPGILGQTLNPVGIGRRDEVLRLWRR
jgi:hypothetical protein